MRITNTVRPSRANRPDLWGPAVVWAVVEKKVAQIKPVTINRDEKAQGGNGNWAFGVWTKPVVINRDEKAPGRNGNWASGIWTKPVTKITATIL